nr:DeoR/GlpR family DNA-binding transcription regulator [Streptococcus loxodontisalivarius]
MDTLVDLLDTSESTVRRDLDELSTEKKLRRVHGGAEKYQSLQEELSNLQKSIKNVHDKESIARFSQTLIDEGDVIFVDAGTTNELLIREIAKDGVTVVTNSIHHAAKLVEKNIKTLIIGGFVKQSTDASIGHLAVEQLSKLNFDKAFIGANGVDADHITTPDIEEAVIKQMVVENAKKTYVLADASKIGHISFVKITSIDKIELVTNARDHELLEKIKEKTRVYEV